VRDRQLLAQPRELLALALTLIKRGAQPSAQRRVAGSLADGKARRSGGVRLDLCPQLGVLVEGSGEERNRIWR
jgi:hypothetical protein